MISSMAMSPRQLVPRSPWKAMAEACGRVTVSVEVGEVGIRLRVRAGV